MEIKVVGTRTGFAFHGSLDGKKTLCGRKVSETYGPVGCEIETMPMDSDEVTIIQGSVTCDKCKESL